MKRVRFLLLGVLLAPSVSFAGAVGAFYSLVETDEAAEGQGYGAKVELDLSDEVALEGRLSRLEDFTPELSLPVVVPNADLEVTPVEVGLQFKIPIQDALTPFVGGGVGVYLLEVEVPGVNIDIDDEFGWYLVGGLRLNISDNLALFAEVQYRKIEGTFESSSFFDDLNRDRADVELKSLGGNFGVLITF